MPDRIYVRPAEFADLKYIMAHNKLREAEVRHKIQREEVFSALQRDEVVGFVQLEYLWSAVPHLTQLQIDVDHVGEGVGRALLAYLEEMMFARHATYLFSSTSIEDTDALAWHRLSGFEEAGFLAGVHSNGSGMIFFRKRLLAAE